MNRLLGGEPLDGRVLTTDAYARNPFPAEAALLAHCVMDPSRVARIETIDVTPPCSTLLDIIHEYGSAVQLLGLAAMLLSLYDPQTDAEHARDATRTKPLLEHIDVYDLATLVDSIRVVELTSIGSFETVVIMMRGQLKPREEKKKRFGKAVAAEIVEPARPDASPAPAPPPAPWNRPIPRPAHSQ